MKKQELFNNATEGFTYQRAPQQMGLYDAAYEKSHTTLLSRL